jgi:uncharacterized protein YuzE
MLKFIHDHEADDVYITLRDAPYAYGDDLDCSRRVDFSADGQPVGIELLDVSRGVNVTDLPDQVAVGRLLERNGIRLMVTHKR